VADASSRACGSPWGFSLALATVVLWAVSGPLLGFSNTWLLIINTITTIVTFLMVFLVQATQNREARALHLKLDELLRATSGARDGMVDLEDADDEELRRFQEEFRRLRERGHGPVDAARGAIEELS
jgi:low affinity Fe/Cu permease